MTAKHDIQEIIFDNETICLKVDGKIIRVAIDKISAKLKQATDFQRQFFKISPSGYGIHWPMIDEDISIVSLLNLSI
jgi:hypothetical protein